MPVGGEGNKGYYGGATTNSNTGFAGKLVEYVVSGGDHTEYGNGVVPVTYSKTKTGYSDLYI